MEATLLDRDVYTPARSAKPRGVARIVIGSLLSLTGLLAVASGGALLDAAGPHNTIPVSSHRLSSTRAIGSETVTIQSEKAVADILGTPTIHVHVTSHTPGATFVGIGPAAQVGRYLASTAVDPAPPNDQTFWVAQTTAGPTANLDWTPRDGSYRVVVMRSDAAPGVAVGTRIGLTFPDLSIVAWGLVLGGSLVLIVGAAVLFFALRRDPTTDRRS